MRDTDNEIEEIRKEIIESRGLIIKTNNLVNSLASDIKTIAKRQAGYERKFTWNSAAAYFLFAFLCFTGLKLASDARIGEIEAEKKRLRALSTQLEKDLSQEKRRAAKRERSELKAERFYELVRQQKRSEAVEAYAELRREPLSRAESAFFRDTMERFRLDLSMAAYQKGLELTRTGRFSEAADSFQKAIDLRDDAAHIPAVKYHLANTLLRLERCAESTVLARAVAEQNVDRELQDDATWLLAQCNDVLGNLDEARNTLRNFLRRWPRSPLASDAKKKMADLTQRMRHAGSTDAK